MVKDFSISKYIYFCMLLYVLFSQKSTVHPCKMATLKKTKNWFSRPIIA